MRALRAIALAVAGAIALWRPVIGQVSTNAPEVVPGGRPATVERIKIHGTALEGNLEGDAVDRDVIVYCRRVIRRSESPLSGGVRVARLLGRRSSSGFARDSRPANDRRRLCDAARRKMIVVVPGFEDAAQRLDVFELRSRRVTSSDTSAHDVVSIHRQPLPHDCRSRKPGSRGPFDGRIRRQPYRHEASGRIRQPLHHEPVLPVATRRRAVNPASEGALRNHDAADSAKLPFGPALSARRARQRGRPIRRTRRSSSTFHSGRSCRRFWRSGPLMRRWPSSISTSRTCVDTGLLQLMWATKTT